MTVKSKSDVDEFIDSIDPSTMRDASYLRAISAALREVADSQERLVAAVKAARDAGDSWTMIGIALGTSKQAAHRKYAGAVGED